MLITENHMKRQTEKQNIMVVMNYPILIVEKQPDI